jgi:hypothetical protein
MSSDPSERPGGAPEGARGTPGEPTEEDLRAAYEAELARITPADMMLQAAVSLLNLGARRLGLTGGGGQHETPAGAPAPTPPAERDLGHVRDAIDGVRALLGILERSMPEDLRPLRDALSQLQIAYAREAQAAEEPDPSAARDAPAPGTEEQAPEEQAPEEPSDAPGPAQASGRLWVPGS